jgi:hypothetical protein
MMTVEMDLEEYRISSADGQLGQETPYGDVAVLRVGAAIYYAVVDDPDATEATVYRVDAVSTVECKVEDVSFETMVDEGEEGEDVVEVATGAEVPGPGEEEEEDDEDDEDEGEDEDEEEGEEDDEEE